MPLGSLSFCLHHQGLERDLEDLGCFLQLLFLCTKHKNGINRRYRVRSIGHHLRDTFRSSKESSLTLVCNRKIETRRVNFPDAIFRVNNIEGKLTENADWSMKRVFFLNFAL